MFNKIKTPDRNELYLYLIIQLSINGTLAQQWVRKNSVLENLQKIDRGVHLHSL